MGSFTDWAEAQFLRHVFSLGDSALLLPVPAHIVVALSKADPTDDGSGLSEPSGAAAYARKTIDSWTMTSDRIVSNSSAVTFDTPSSDWTDGDNPIRWAAAYAVYTSGDLAAAAWPVGDTAGYYMIAHGQLPADKQVLSGQQPSFAAGSIKFQFDGTKITNYLSRKLLQHLFKITSYTPPAAVSVGVATDATTPAADGTGFTEPAEANNYSRVEHATWAVPSGPETPTTSTANTGGIAFPQAQTGNWGDMQYVGVYDDAGTPNQLMNGVIGTLGVPTTINIGDTLSIGDGTLVITMS